MPIQACYVHTNLVARDWRILVEFYIQVFGCQPVPPERHLEAEWVAQATGVPGAAISGMHLRLPGYGDRGPTLEIFQYNFIQPGENPAINRPGLAHLAFGVDDVAAGLEAVLTAGGRQVGELVRVQVTGVGWLVFVYAADPEGNILELQKWEQQAKDG
ncbi:MAG: VOC family protein [Anaerolineaceae bacterium]|nr:VOC family protein [Anaerolineaceae bacterium]